jgi:hypothetical protein
VLFWALNEIHQVTGSTDVETNLQRARLIREKGYEGYEDASGTESTNLQPSAHISHCAILFME